MTTDAPELSSFFEATEMDTEWYERYGDAVHVSFHAHERFGNLVREHRKRVDQGTGDTLKLAMGLLLLGKMSEALEYFQTTPAGKLRHYYAAEAALGLGRLDTAIEELTQAAQQGWDAFEIDMRLAAVQVRKGALDAAENLVRKHEARGQDRAEWYFARGLLVEAQDEREEALETFERALTLNPDHAEAMFRCARLYDMFGDDRQAIELYQRLALQPRAHVNALLNAAVVYEDIGKFNAAADCLRRVLRAYPNHTRARLFLKDVESCLEMVIDEAGEDHVDARGRLLDMPLSEFELSVRARNCLKKMNVRTLGELMRLSEVELLAYKNFGETSLNEIKALLTKKGLRLGQSPEEIELAGVAPEEPVAPPKPPVPVGQAALLAKPVSDLELSVRARRCLQRLNVQSLANLVEYSEADLLATRNFGVTSLNEVKARLYEHGLQLAPRKPG